MLKSLNCLFKTPFFRFRRFFWPLILGFCFFVRILTRIPSNMYFSLSIAALIGSASSTVLWDGRFNNFKSSSDLSSWSWSNQVGPYQYYIVGVASSSSCTNSKILIRAAWIQRHYFVHQLRPVIQESCRHEQYPRRQIHVGFNFILEWADYAEDGVDSTDDCRY